jgi:small GTP-binding protein
MLKKKICMLGSFGVGKTSLTARFVLSMFDEKYHTTIGVKVDKKVLQIEGSDVTLMLWDMAGEEEDAPVKLNYVRDAAGYVLVIDGTRGATCNVAQSIQERVRTNIGLLPFVVAINKTDQRESWELQESQLRDLAALGGPLFETSAKTGEKVEDAFLALAGLILAAQEAGDDGFPEERS